MSDKLNERFYAELFAWYEWAATLVKFPKGDADRVHLTRKDNHPHLIRLIMRFIFVWLIKQKKLVPDWIFAEREIGAVLRNFQGQSAENGDYYNGIVQNLFFAALNKERSERAFTDDAKESANQHYGIKTFFRDRKGVSYYAVSHAEIIGRFMGVPFLNGGLFECLDRLEGDRIDECRPNHQVQTYVDGFSRETARCAFVPDVLFWGKAESGHEGLIELFKKYNFTMEESTTELLGKALENLLWTDNPETRETARELADYMVDDLLKAYLKEALIKKLNTEDADEKLTALLSYSAGTPKFSGEETDTLIRAINGCKILDPACGTGAFLVGILNKLVLVLRKLDPDNSHRESDYGRKLYLIENCIYGVDIQSIAIQICKLRFFITLITDGNFGICPLPNLETKFVAANTLIGLPRASGILADPGIETAQTALLGVRHRHFGAKSADEKQSLRKQDEHLSERLAVLLKQDGFFTMADAEQLAGWNPYARNVSSPWFDAEWMFGVKGGFDMVIGNSPYVRLQNNAIPKSAS